MTPLPSSPTPPDAPTPGDEYATLRTIAYAANRSNDDGVYLPLAHLAELRSLLRAYEGMRAERTLLAMLAADTPQFDNPLVAWEARALRDRILAARASAPDSEAENG